MSMEGYHQNPNWFRRKLKGIKGKDGRFSARTLNTSTSKFGRKDLLNAEAVTDASGVAELLATSSGCL